jgi:hypothetical protein
LIAKEEDMTNKIKRYNLPTENSYGDEILDGWLRMEHDSEGKFVEYEDHLAIVEKLKAEIDDLKFELQECRYFEDVRASYEN